VRHNSARNVDSEVLGRIARASLRHEGEVPGTIVGRSRVRGVRTANKPNKHVAVAQSKSFFMLISP